MKPRTQLQFEVLNLSKYHLPHRTYELLQWAREAVLEHKGFATKTWCACMRCGGSFSPDLVKRGKVVCPYKHCNTKLQVEQTKRRTDKQRAFFAYAEICGEFQVVRYYELVSTHKIGQTRDVQCWEVMQHWIRADGKREVVALNHTIGIYGDSWNGKMEIRNKKNKVRYSEQLVYDFYTEHFHPDSVIKPMYQKYGINRNLAGLSFLEAIEIVPKEPKAETLLKAKQYRILSHFTGSRKIAIQAYWASVKIAIRNNYKPVDAGMWLDYLGLLRLAGKDLRNAHYVCPKDLKAEHDRYVQKRQRMLDREKRARQREEAIASENAYREFIQDFLDLEFGDNEIRISPLKSIEEFEIEGKELKHCVFVSNYFKKTDTLILSAKLNGVRLETIQINLTTMKVEQCRGNKNENSEHHDRILKLVKRNIKLIKQCLIAA